MNKDSLLRLVVCDASGQPVEPMGFMPDILRENCEASAALYAKIGFSPPWVSYVAVAGIQPVGGGAFVGGPKKGRVEIAYFTLQRFEGRGYATEIGRILIGIAAAAKPGIVVAAKTLPEKSASTRILQKLGFMYEGNTVDSDVGSAWRWALHTR